MLKVHCRESALYCIAQPPFTRRILYPHGNSHQNNPLYTTDATANTANTMKRVRKTVKVKTPVTVVKKASTPSPTATVTSTSSTHDVEEHAAPLPITAPKVPIELVSPSPSNTYDTEDDRAVTTTTPASSLPKTVFRPAVVHASGVRDADGDEGGDDAQHDFSCSNGGSTLCAKVHPVPGSAAHRGGTEATSLPEDVLPTLRLLPEGSLSQSHRSGCSEGGGGGESSPEVGWLSTIPTLEMERGGLSGRSLVGSLSLSHRSGGSSEGGGGGGGGYSPEVGWLSAEVSVPAVPALDGGDEAELRCALSHRSGGSSEGGGGGGGSSPEVGWLSTVPIPSLEVGGRRCEQISLGSRQGVHRSEGGGGGGGGGSPEVGWLSAVPIPSLEVGGRKCSQIALGTGRSLASSRLSVSPRTEIGSVCSESHPWGDDANASFGSFASLGLPTASIYGGGGGGGGGVETSPSQPEVRVTYEQASTVLIESSGTQQQTQPASVLSVDVTPPSPPPPDITALLSPATSTAAFVEDAVDMLEVPRAATPLSSVDASDDEYQSTLRHYALGGDCGDTDSSSFSEEEVMESEDSQAVSSSDVRRQRIVKAIVGTRRHRRPHLIIEIHDSFDFALDRGLLRLFTSPYGRRRRSPSATSSVSDESNLSRKGSGSSIGSWRSEASPFIGNVASAPKSSFLTTSTFARKRGNGGVPFVNAITLVRPKMSATQLGVFGSSLAQYIAEGGVVREFSFVDGEVRGAAAIHALSSIIHNIANTVEQISLEGTRFTETRNASERTPALVALCAALTALPYVTSLNLCEISGFSPKLWEAVCRDASQCGTLRSLSLRGNHFRERNLNLRAVKCLAVSLQNQMNLTRIDLSETGVHESTEAMKWLQDAFLLRCQMLDWEESGENMTLKLFLLRGETDASEVFSIDTGWNALFYAAMLDRRAEVETLLQARPEMLETRDVFGRSPLHICCGAGAHTVLTALLEELQDYHPSSVRLLLNQEDDNGLTPLTHAVERCHLECTRLLLQNEALVDASAMEAAVALLVEHNMCVQSKFSKVKKVDTNSDMPCMQPTNSAADLHQAPLTAKGSFRSSLRDGTKGGGGGGGGTHAHCAKARMRIKEQLSTLAASASAPLGEVAFKLFLPRFLLYVIFLVFITHATSAISTNMGSEDFISTRSLRDRLEGFEDLVGVGDEHLPDLRHLSTIPELWEWCDLVLLGVIKHAGSDDGLDVVGSVRFRQIRVAQVPCDAVRAKHLCHEPYTPDTEDTRLLTLADKTWEWVEQNEPVLLDSSLGANYGSNGYIEMIPATDTDMASSKLQMLKDLEWVDLGTRAMFVDLTFLQKNTKHHIACHLLFEFSLSGEILPTLQLVSIIKRSNITGMILCGLVLSSVLLLLDECFDIYKKYRLHAKAVTNVRLASVSLSKPKKTQSHRLQVMWRSAKKATYRAAYHFATHMCQDWNAADYLIIIMLTCAISDALSIRAQNDVTNARVAAIPAEGSCSSPAASFVSFAQLSVSTRRLRDMCGLLIVISYTKTLKYMSLLPIAGPTVNAILATVVNPNVLTFMTLFLVISFSLSVGLHFTLGNNVKEFSTPTHAGLAFFRMVFGDFDVKAFTSHTSVVGVVLFVVCLVVANFVLMNILVAVVGITYEESLNVCKKEWQVQMIKRLRSDVRSSKRHEPGRSPWKPYDAPRLAKRAVLSTYQYEAPSLLLPLLHKTFGRLSLIASLLPPIDDDAPPAVVSTLTDLCERAVEVFREARPGAVRALLAWLDPSDHEDGVSDMHYVLKAPLPRPGGPPLTSPKTATLASLQAQLDQLAQSDCAGSPLMTHTPAASMCSPLASKKAPSASPTGERLQQEWMVCRDFCKILKMKKKITKSYRKAWTFTGTGFRPADGTTFSPDILANQGETSGLPPARVDLRGGDGWMDG